jgi:hypothetical protein
MARNTVARSMHDVGLAAWFGGSLMGAVGLNAASGAVQDPRQRAQVATEGWGRWAPINAAAIGAHLVGGLGILLANRGRLRNQKGVAAMTLSKTALTGLAIAATALSGAEGAKVAQRPDVPVRNGAVPLPETPDDVAGAQQKLRGLQWAIPAATAGLLVLNALAGEQQRPSEVHRGVAERLRQRAPRR